MKSTFLASSMPIYVLMSVPAGTSILISSGWGFEKSLVGPGVGSVVPSALSPFGLLVCSGFTSAVESNPLSNIGSFIIVCPSPVKLSNLNSIVSIWDWSSLEILSLYLFHCP